MQPDPAAVTATYPATSSEDHYLTDTGLGTSFADDRSRQPLYHQHALVILAGDGKVNSFTSETT